MRVCEEKERERVESWKHPLQLMEDLFLLAGKPKQACFFSVSCHEREDGWID